MPGRHDPEEHFYYLLDIAEVLCFRTVLSVRAAAQFVVRYHRPEIGWDRLAALYRRRRRELEIQIMCSRHGKQTWMAMEPDRWLALVERAEELVRQDPSLEALARKVPKRKLSKRRHWPFSLWRPAELVEFFKRVENAEES